MEPAVYIISRIPGASETTVPATGRDHRAWRAYRVGRAAEVHHQSGLWPDQEPQEEAMRQLRLRAHNACILAMSYFDAGFTPVIDDVVIGTRLNDFLEELRGRPLRFVMLLLPAEVVRQRDAERPEKHVFDTWGHLDEVARETRRVGLWLDTSEMTVEETVAAIKARAEESLVFP